MGAYLTQPITEKISEDKSFKGMTYGASSMQGWRITQEDAHNCLTDFDPETNSSMFAVYDGHGGSEVAQYCALHLPDFIKSLPEYKSGDLGKCSEAGFLQFDATLTEEHVIKELKILAGDDDGGDEDESSATPCVHSEAEMLKTEANMPLDQLLSKYEHLPPGLPIKNLRKNEQLCSPMIHAKKTVFSESDEEQACGSSNCVSSSDCNNSNASSIAISLEDKLLTNGHADNENNLNKEKEIQDSLNSRNESSKEVLCDIKSEDTTNSNDSEPSSSTDNVTFIKKVSEPECSSTVGNSEETCKSSAVALSSLSISSSVGSSSNTSSQAGGSCSSSDSGVASEGSSQLSSNAASCSSSSEPSASSSSSSASGVSASSSSASGVSASSSSEARNSAASVSNAGPSNSCSSSSGEAGSSTATSDNTKGTIMGLGEDDSDDDDVDDEYEDMDSDEEDDDGEEEEGEDYETGESIEHPYMDMSNEEPGSDSGCTACLALLRGNQLVVANAGDSRCVLSRAGLAVELSFDHKPEDDIEKTRIEKAGGKVTADGRVNGGLNLSRALGDHWYKRNGDLPPEEQMISASPDIQSVTLEDEDEFIIIACDGIWNYLSSQEVVDYVRERLKSEEKRKKPSIICEEMFDYCLAPNTFGDGTGCDNMTCIIIVLHPDKDPQPVTGKRSTDEMENSQTDEVQIKKKPKV